MTRPVGMPAGPASPNRSGRFSFVDLVFSTVPPDQRVHCPAVSSYRSTAQCALSGIEQTRAHGRFMEWCDKKWVSVENSGGTAVSDGRISRTWQHGLPQCCGTKDRFALFSFLTTILTTIPRRRQS